MPGTAIARPVAWSIHPVPAAALAINVKAPLAVAKLFAGLTTDRTCITAKVTAADHLIQGRYM